MSGHNLGDQVACPQCGVLVELRETPVNAAGRSVRYWTECPCFQAAIKRAEDRTTFAVTHEAGRLDPLSHSDGYDLASVRHYTLDTFDASRLGPGTQNPYTVAVRWLEQVRDLSHGEGPKGPPCCLYFYSAGKGRGKTHLAAGIALKAEALGKLVAFADEIGYIERYWAASFEAKRDLSALPAERAWLTVLDDMGQRESRPDGLRDAWYDIVNPRSLKHGWTIITSNRTPQQLLEQRTINEATYSRIVGMTRSRLVEFQGSDQRMGGGGR